MKVEPFLEANYRKMKREARYSGAEDSLPNPHSTTIRVLAAINHIKLNSEQYAGIT